MLSISTKEMMTRAESQDNCLRTAPSLQPINVKMVVKLSGFYDYSIILLFPHKLTESNIDLNHYQNSVIITDLDCYVYKICWLVSHSQPRILTFFILITNWSVSTINTIWQYLLYGLWRTIEHSLYVIRNLIECGSIHPLLEDVVKILINWVIPVRDFCVNQPAAGSPRCGVVEEVNNLGSIPSCWTGKPRTNLQLDNNQPWTGFQMLNSPVTS